MFDGFRFVVGKSPLLWTACVVIVLQSVATPNARGQDNDRLKRIKVPLPSAVIEGGRDKVPEVTRWMSDIVTATTAHSFECTVQYSMSRTGLTKKHLNDDSRFGSAIANVGNFRLGREIGSGTRRIVSSYQPMSGHSYDQEELLRRTRMVDIYERDGKTVIALANGHAANDYLLRGDVGEFTYFLESSGAFHPVRAAVVPVVQTLTGGAMEEHAHSILPNRMKGVLTIGQYTHVLIDFTRLRMIVTFQEKCPVQLEIWWPRGEREEDREITDVVRSVWRNASKDTRLPVRIQAMHLSQVRTAEYTADIQWRIGDAVEKRFFDRSTLGLLMPSFDDKQVSKQEAHGGR